ncbi:MAG: EF-hand domain-containing protein [Alphaproteobacteria bacterium]
MQTKSLTILLSSVAMVGIVTLTASAIAAPTQQDRHQMRGERMWQKIDANADGSVSVEEFRAGSERAFSRLDKNNDGKITQEEAAQMRFNHRHHHRGDMGARQGWFDRIDADHDGVITKAESDLARDQMISRMKERTDQAFTKGDKNNDGKVTKDEFAEFAKDRHNTMTDPYRREAARKRWFDMLDTDHDGSISKAESMAAADKRFASIDADHNGKVTQEEMKAAHETMRQHMKDKMTKPN